MLRAEAAYRRRQVRQAQLAEWLLRMPLVRAHEEGAKADGAEWLKDVVSPAEALPGRITTELQPGGLGPILEL